MRAPLPHKHLMTLRLEVNSKDALQIGRTPEGRRAIATITGGSFEGDRLCGKVLPARADWARFRDDRAIMIDVRLTLQTDDGKLIYLSYEGRFIGTETAMVDLALGKRLSSESYSLVTVAKFECGAEEYDWLNDIVAIGIGEQSGFNPNYTIYEIG